MVTFCNHQRVGHPVHYPTALIGAILGPTKIVVAFLLYAVHVRYLESESRTKRGANVRADVQVENPGECEHDSGSEPERCSGMKVNTDSGIKPDSFCLPRNRVRCRRYDSASRWRWTAGWQAASPEKGRIAYLPGDRLCNVPAPLCGRRLRRNP